MKCRAGLGFRSLVAGLGIGRRRLGVWGLGAWEVYNTVKVLVGLSYLKGLGWFRA